MIAYVLKGHGKSKKYMVILPVRKSVENLAEHVEEIQQASVILQEVHVDFLLKERQQDDLTLA